MMSRYKEPRRRRTIRRRFKIGPAIGRVLAGAVLAVLALMALTQSTGREKAIYQATALREEQGGVQQEINDLKLLEARAKTLERIAQSEVKSEMVSVGDDVEYLDDVAAVAGASTTQ